jgi:septal ring factor EnvC (AmiA/AmiB activator)
VYAYHRDGWKAVTAEWKGDAAWASFLVLGAWSLLFAFCVGETIYQDHVRAKARIVYLQGVIDKKNTTIGNRDSEIATLKNAISLKDETISNLQGQVQSQQTTISQALLQLGKAQQEELQPFKIIPYFIGHVPSNDNPHLPAEVDPKNRTTG